MIRKQTENFSSVVQIIKGNARAGIITRKEILQLNVSEYYLSILLKEKLLKPLVRGVYLISSAPYPDYLDYIMVSLRVKDPIICQISALSYHNMTLEFERCIHVAIPPKGKRPHVTWPPVCYYEYPGKTLEIGVERIKQPGWDIKVFNREKALIDCLVFEELFMEESILDAFDQYLHYPNENQPLRLVKYAEQLGVAGKLRERIHSFAHHAEIEKFHSELKHYKTCY